MDNQNTIETERLLLRKFASSDAEAMFFGWANDPEVTKYMTWNPHENIDQTASIIKRWVEEYENPKTFRFAITLKAVGELIGSIDVVGYVDGAPEIGYCLSRKHWNNGYMSEALRAMLSFLVDKGFKRAVIEADERNIGSNRVITKCGFRFTHQQYKEHCSAFKIEPITVNWYEIDLAR